MSKIFKKEYWLGYVGLFSLLLYACSFLPFDSFYTVDSSHFSTPYLIYLFKTCTDSLFFSVGFYFVILMAIWGIHLWAVKKEWYLNPSWIYKTLLALSLWCLLFALLPISLGFFWWESASVLSRVLLFLLGTGGVVFYLYKHHPHLFKKFETLEPTIPVSQEDIVQEPLMEKVSLEYLEPDEEEEELEIKEDLPILFEEEDKPVMIDEEPIVHIIQETETQIETQTQTQTQTTEVIPEATPIKEEKKIIPFFSSEELIKTIQQKNPPRVVGPNQAYFEDLIARLEAKLAEFRIEAKVINILKGPVVDTFELELGSGVRVSKVTTIQDDLSLALSGAPIRMVYPLKGRTTIGVEIPRNPREVILLDEVLKSQKFNENKMILPVCMGKDAFGEAAVVDLAKMPHMLVAGATGAGKSVFINTLLVSLLIKQSPQKMKLILIDPKQLELAQYSKLPHLCLPVVTEPKLVSLSLCWATEEMERRYTLLKEMGVRNIEGYNEKIKNTKLKDLPYIVIVIDEFADLILSKHGKDIENSVCRLAAKARASGIHIVLATQRPSVDVITGLIKNNFPTRVSFRVTSSQDSKTILTRPGSEKLLGMGDMLFKSGIEMERMHSAYIDENEIDKLMDKLTAIPQEFDEEAIEFIEKNQQDENSEGTTSVLVNETASLYDQAVEVVVQYNQASASFLQRRLRIGYNRAANLIEEMEQKGVVGPAQGSKPREIFAANRG